MARGVDTRRVKVLLETWGVHAGRLSAATKRWRHTEARGGERDAPKRSSLTAVGTSSPFVTSTLTSVSTTSPRSVEGPSGRGEAGLTNRKVSSGVWRRVLGACEAWSFSIAVSYCHIEPRTWVYGDQRSRVWILGIRVWGLGLRRGSLLTSAGSGNGSVGGRRFMGGLNQASLIQATLIEPLGGGSRKRRDAKGRKHTGER